MSNDRRCKTYGLLWSQKFKWLKLKQISTAKKINCNKNSSHERKYIWRLKQEQISKYEPWLKSKKQNLLLTHNEPLSSFVTPWKHQKTLQFYEWLKTGYNNNKSSSPILSQCCLLDPIKTSENLQPTFVQNGRRVAQKGSRLNFKKIKHIWKQRKTVKTFHTIVFAT